MLASKKTKRGVVGAVVLAGILAVSGYALTNTLTYEEASTLAGFGEQEVQVLEVTDIDYTLAAADPTQVDTVVFTIDSAIVTGDGDGVAFMQINDTYTWSACDAVTDGDLTVSCDVTGAATGNITDVGENAEEIKLVLAE